MTATPFSRFLAAYSVNAAGSALSAGALPLIAVLVLHVSALQVAVLAATGLVATAVLALPLGSLVDRSNIRNLMVAVNVAGFAALATVPATAAVGMLTFTHLCGVAVVQSVVSVAYRGRW